MLLNYLRRLPNRLSPNALRRLVNIWPPFLGAGIHVDAIAPDYRHINVSMKLRWYNKNYVGTHFGGSMLSMTDPFYMLMLIKNLGEAYVVWDKASSINFKKVGRGILRAQFKLSGEQIQAIRDEADKLPKYIFDLPIDLKDEAGDVVASVIKTLYVKRK